ncbi:MAG: sugar phosphate isomerase/epimerase [Caldilineaceae bacterium]|nr:sugar phosphate isomerase/epimerase [Caldilineaceae bacterium]
MSSTIDLDPFQRIKGDPMTRLGLGTYAYAWAIGVPGYPVTEPMDGFAFLHRAADLNLPLVQIADNLPLDALSTATLQALVNEAQRLGLEIEVGTRGIAPDHLRRYLRIAQMAGSPILRLVIDTSTHHPHVDEVIATLRAVAPEFEAADVTLAIENHDRFTAATFVAILDAVDSTHLGICLDTVNSFGALEGPDVVIETLGPHVVNLHLKDFTIRRADHNMGFVISGAPAGQGLLDIPALLARLHGFGRSFNAILELWPAPEADMARTITKEADWVMASVAYLRKVMDGLQSP